MPGGASQDIALPLWKWEMINMDFITGLPRSQNQYDSIWVIADRMTKSAYFLPVRTNFLGDDYARLYIEDIVHLHRALISIISDRVHNFLHSFEERKRVILTSQKKEVSLHGKCHSDPLDLRLLRSEESWELLEKRVFGEEHCPDELKGSDEGDAIKLLPIVRSPKAVFSVPCKLSKGQRYYDLSIGDLWGGEGLVEPTDLKSVEEVMDLYVDELISSSLLTMRGVREQICQIHDLVHDFCLIKDRKEKLFDLMSSTVLSSSSSSDPMLRGMIIHYDEHLHTNEIPFLSNPD
ncbi:hypothetical protein CQW23_13206 [Capsicum baccatum]|uniref:Uncharacterized protein n=1 Tax=Capsicum baccatum TaxID=33114 RepID=A0A2G2WUR4_CAPBA|nr:hypothetical protein CQW23_13206 [Capsicum baccatum]